MKELRVKNIKTGTEEMPLREGENRNVSTIEITLTSEAEPKK